MLSHAADRQFFGANPGGPHLVNVALHMANTLLLFALLLQMLPLPRGLKSNFWPSAIIAALFGLHPLRVESVAWVAERKDVLSGFFFLLALWAYVQYAQMRSRQQQPPVPDAAEVETANASEAPQSASGVLKWYFITLVIFALGLMAKPMLVTLPCLLLLIDFWPLNRSTKDGAVNWRALVLEKIPFFLLSAGFSVITFFAQKKDSLVVDFKTLPMQARLANAVVSYARYIGKTIWPKSLAAYYPMEKWQASQVIFAIVLVAGISALAVWMVRRRPWMFVGWFWFVGLLFPVIGISQVAMQSMADRFAYLPHIGLFIFVVWTLVELSVRQAKIALSALGVAALVMAGVSAHQVRFWESSETLFRRVLAVTPDNDITEYYMGMVLLVEKHDMTGAEYYFKRTLEMNPKYSGAYMRLGDIYMGRRQYDEAEQQYRKAVEAEPNATICNLKLAKLLAQKPEGKEEAIRCYRVALKNRPEIAEAQYQLGQLLNDKHDVGGAIAAFQQAVHVKPDMTDALNDLAWALATQSDAKLRNGLQAVEFASRAAELTHHNAPNVLDTLAAAYAEAGRYDDAVATLRDAIKRADGMGAVNITGDLEAHLKLYEAKRPFRE
jgi:tetratricopeptide (TPR) repeat protein